MGLREIREGIERARGGRLGRAGGGDIPRPGHSEYDVPVRRPPPPRPPPPPQPDDDYPPDDWRHEQGYQRGGGIHIKPSHRGLLHKELGIPEGEKIPQKRLDRAGRDAGPAMKRRIQFAENAKKFGR